MKATLKWVTMPTDHADLELHDDPRLRALREQLVGDLEVLLELVTESAAVEESETPPSRPSSFIRRFGNTDVQSPTPEATDE